MGCFDKASRPRQVPELPQRLRRLDEDLMVNRVKDFETLNATHGEYKIAVRIFRIKDEYIAYVRYQGIERRTFGRKPSDAWYKMVQKLGSIVTKLDFDKHIAPTMDMSFGHGQGS